MNKYLNQAAIKRNAKSYIMFLALLGIAVIFSILTKGVFFMPRNISMLARQTTVVGIIAIAMMFVIVTGRIDLSIGTGLGCCGTVAAALMVWNHWNTYATFAAVLAVGALIGMWNGFWIAYRRVPAFIATLGSMLIFRGLKLGIGKSMSIAPMNADFTFIGQGYLSKPLSWAVAIAGVVGFAILVLSGRRSKTRYNIEQPSLAMDVVKVSVIGLALLGVMGVFNQYQGLPIPVLLLMILALIFNFVANKTTYGRSVYAIGGNEEAATLAGIKTNSVIMSVYVITGILAACAGMVLTARLDAATAAAGDGMELDAIASCVIGGVSMSGGSGRISGVIIGALIMAALDNGMSLINLENFWQFVVKGLVLILAVWSDSALNRRA